MDSNLPASIFATDCYEQPRIAVGCVSTGLKDNAASVSFGSSPPFDAARNTTEIRGC